jgi:RarD protein
MLIVEYPSNHLHKGDAIKTLKQHPLLWLIASVSLWGVMNPMASYAVTKFSAINETFVEILTGSLTLFIFMKITRRKIQIPWSKVWWMGLLQPGVCWLLGNIGYQESSASFGVIILSSEVAFTVLLSIIFLKEKLSRYGWAALAIALFGLVIANLQSPDKKIYLPHPSRFGAIFFLLSSLSFAFYAVLVRKFVKSEEVFNLALGQNLISLCLILILFIFEHNFSNFHQSKLIWGSALASGALGAGLAFILYNFAAQKLPSSVTGIALSVIPVIGVIGSILIGRGSLNPDLFIGGLLVIGAISILARLEISD